MKTNYSKEEMKDLLKAFKFFHHLNPEIWEAVQKEANNKIRKGWKHYGIGAIAETIRWEMRNKEQRIQNEYGERSDFKMHNTYRALYSRMFAIKYPQHRNFLIYKTSMFDDLTIRQINELIYPKATKAPNI